MKQVIIAASAAILLTGCVPLIQAARQQQQKAEMQQAGTELKACTASVYHNPDYAPIVPHLVSLEEGGQPTMAQLSDDTLPTKQESSLLIKMHDDLMPCRQAFLQKMQSLAPAAIQVFSEEWAEGDQIAVRLVKRKISWGEATQQRQQIIAAAQKNFTATAQTQAALQAQQQAANAASVQAHAAVMQATRPQPVQTQAPAFHMTNTNCQALGNSLNCNSYGYR